MGKIFSSIIKIVDGAISVTVNTVMKVMDFTRKNPGTVIYGAAAIGALWMGHDIQKHGASIGNKFMEAYKNLEAVK